MAIRGVVMMSSHSNDTTQSMNQIATAAQPR